VDSNHTGAAMSLSRKVQNISPSRKSEFASIALLLQGGGALAAYQAGAYEALAEAALTPDWVGGISMGAVNGAIIAGNKPGDRLDRLKEFWRYLTANRAEDRISSFSRFLMTGIDDVRPLWNGVSAAMTATFGVPGFFAPHAFSSFPPPMGLGATSFYDTSEFVKTLNRFIDFKYLNSGEIRFTTSAVNVRSGNYTEFDTERQRLGPEHIMASGALPPGLPAIEIDGERFWDGGLISNTPLDWVLNQAKGNTLVFQVDLWSAEGPFPEDILGVATRQKEIQYSSRTRAVTNRFKEVHRKRHLFSSLYNKLPPQFQQLEEARELTSDCGAALYNIVHLIYRARPYEHYSKDFEFSRRSMEEHWMAGCDDAKHSLGHREILKLPSCSDGVMTYDFLKDNARN
jgi:NTE family protein